MHKQVLFNILLAIGFYFLLKNFKKILKNILIGLLFLPIALLIYPFTFLGAIYRFLEEYPVYAKLRDIFLSPFYALFLPGILSLDLFGKFGGGDIHSRSQSLQFWP